MRRSLSHRNAVRVASQYADMLFLADANIFWYKTKPRNKQYQNYNSCTNSEWIQH